MTTADHTLDALQQTKEAKEDVTKTGGIGTDLQPALFAWADHGTGMAVLALGGNTPLQELHRITAATTTLARMGAHTIAVAKEGYAAERGTEHDPRPLAERFATDPTVHECITVCTVDANGDASFAIQPYSVGFGRVVQWHDNPDMVTLRADDLPATAILHGALTNDHDPITVQQALATLDDLGFAALWTARH